MAAAAVFLVLKVVCNCQAAFAAAELKCMHKYSRPQAGTVSRYLLESVLLTKALLFTCCWLDMLGLLANFVSLCFSFLRVVLLQSGKSYTLNQILPRALADCAAPGFGSSSQILMLHVDCEVVMAGCSVSPLHLYLTC